MELYILYEHASGYAIFRTTEFEEVAVFIPQVRESILNISKFRTNVIFVTYEPFKEQRDALQNMQKLADGELSTDIQLFLENNIPRTKKSKQPIVLGVADPDLASVISEKLGIQCLSSDLVKEILRGIRVHFYKLVKGFRDEESAVKSQLALAHNFSRARLCYDATRQDCMVIEAKALVDDLEKDINTLGKRIRKGYAFHFPELFQLIPHNMQLYIKCVNLIGDRKNLPEDIKEQLNCLLRDSAEVENILAAAHTSMGTDICTEDLENLRMVCERAISVMNNKDSSTEYLISKLKCTAPNLSYLVGEEIASQLIISAGGLEKLARLPSTTVQVLGAQKKIFRTLNNTNQKPAICGLLSNTTFLGKAGINTKGRLARLISYKACLAARVDCFRKNADANTDFGRKLFEEVTHAIKFINKVDFREDSNQNQKGMSRKRKKSLKRKAESFKANETPDMQETTVVNGNLGEDAVNNSDGDGITASEDKLDSFGENSSDDGEELLRTVSVKKKAISKKKTVKKSKIVANMQSIEDEELLEDSTNFDKEVDANEESPEGGKQVVLKRNLRSSRKSVVKSVKDLENEDDGEIEDMKVRARACKKRKSVATPKKKF